MTLVALNVQAGRLAPIQEFSSPTDLPTLADVEACIIGGAAAITGWGMEKKEPGHMVGTLLVRQFKVVVDIKYDTKKYTISYKDSENLEYDGTQIHASYHRWVQNLRAHIDKKILAKKAGGIAGSTVDSSVQPAATAPAAAPAAETPAQQTVEERLQKLQELFEKGLIDENEYKTRKDAILKEI
ncbi:MAG TPA: hypothetical protein DCZ95_19940 [Verrucomicrobia bacterium]|nr:MAG: hypothetical protein A2X46_17840 [Lentisphaerae bacterium GWF2_57_35]HBA86358.1 hypothetical protein [Verrucomicrobiota bacterium]